MLATIATIFLWAAAATAIASLTRSLVDAWRAHARLLRELERFDAAAATREMPLPRLRAVTRVRYPGPAASPCALRAAA